MKGPFKLVRTSLCQNNEKKFVRNVTGSDQMVLADTLNGLVTVFHN